MLFLLSSEIQSGKTRWLEQLVQQLSQHSIPYAGVLAPGVWRQLNEDDFAALQNAAFSARINSENAGPYEKLGIDNILLPSEERIIFARRVDLPEHNDSASFATQSTPPQLDWVIYTEAIKRVNAHFQDLELYAFENQCSYNNTLPTVSQDMHYATQAGILIVDEIGRIELQQNEGIVAAKEMIKRGPSPLFPHAVVVVRSKLLSLAKDEFSSAWGTPVVLSPTPANFDKILTLYRES